MVAVGKTKPADDLKTLYDAGQRHFGENYVQEIVDKAHLLPNDLQWHFIGHLQSNKCKLLLSGVPSLYMVETIDSIKLADKLNKLIKELRPDRKLNILVQVNTSDEEK